MANSITVPIKSEQLTGDHIRDVCRIGQGAACCSYLMYAPKGFECAKGTPMLSMIETRRKTMTSQGDNCFGPPSFKPTPAKDASVE